MPTFCRQRELDWPSRVGLYFFSREFVGINLEADYAHDDTERVGPVELDLRYEFAWDGKLIKYSIIRATQWIRR